MTTRSTVGDAYHPWTTYIHAREEARRRGDRRVGTDHLLLALLQDQAIESVVGVTLNSARDMVQALDREALRAVGIATDLDAPPLPMRETPARPTLKAVVKDRLPLSPAAKLALRDAAKPMYRGGHITPQQVLLTLIDLRVPDPSAELLAALGVDTAAVRERLSASSAAA